MRGLNHDPNAHPDQLLPAPDAKSKEKIEKRKQQILAIRREDAKESPRGLVVPIRSRFKARTTERVSHVNAIQGEG